MASIQIIVGSVLGASEYVAEALSEKLQEFGHKPTLHFEPNFDEIEQNDYWLICSSTHGAGDLPDNIQSFADALPSKNLNKLPYCVVSLGDSSYDTFCQGGEQLYNLMLKADATALAKPLEIDVLQHPIPEDYAIDWLSDNKALFES